MASKKDLLTNGAASFFSRPSAAPAQSEKPAHEQSGTTAEPAAAPGPVIGRGRPRKGESPRWSSADSTFTSVTFNSEQYLKVREIAYQERLSIKETLFLLLSEGISKYEKTGKLKK